MRVLALAALISIALGGAGCLRASFSDGQLLCSGVPNRECPQGYHCELDNYCYANGHHPVFDLATMTSSTPPDYGFVDPTDMTVSLPPDMTVSLPPSPDLLPLPPDLLPLPPDLVSTTD
jgi:hypothetical protein